MTPTTADTRKLYQQVAGSVAEAITSGRYVMGQRLPSERDLAEEFGVSRPTVREAMIALEIRGLVEARQGSGIYVMHNVADGPGPDLDIGAFELTEARRLFEGEAAALAATTITDVELEELESILADMIGENAYTGFTGEQADRRFHVTIAKATRNAAIVMTVETLWDLRYRSPLCVAMLERGRKVGVRPLIDDHREILNALRRREPQAARHAMRAHLGRVIDDLLTATEMEAMEKTRSDVEARRQEVARRAAI
jgi:GntR family hexuronate regulon transcriptional repressor